MIDRLAESAQKLVTRLNGGGPKGKNETYKPPPNFTKKWEVVAKSRQVKKITPKRRKRWYKRVHFLLRILIPSLDGMPCTTTTFKFDILLGGPFRGLQ